MNRWCLSFGKWFKVAGFCHATITCDPPTIIFTNPIWNPDGQVEIIEGGSGFSADCCCNGCLSLAEWALRDKGTCGFYDDAGKLPIHPKIHFPSRFTVKSNRILRYLSFVAVAFVFLIGAMFFYCGVIEEYFPLYPAIDTNFASGFSETAFGNVEIGMGEEEVRTMLGEPLWTQKSKDGTIKWWYSGDGKSRWGDFAWLGRSLMIKDGTVSSIERRVYYD